MARKHIGRTLSGISLLATLLLMLAPNVHAQSSTFGGGRVTFTISGSTGVGDVELRGFPSGLIKSDGAGYYRVEIPYGWSGTVTLVKAGYSFDPNPKSFGPVKNNLDGQDFVPSIKHYTLSGTVSMGNVELDGFPQGPIQVGPDGKYKADLEYGWSGIIKPVKEGFAFTPPSRQYDNLNRSMTLQDFQAKPQTYKISGRIMVDNGPLAGVQLKGFPSTVTTKPDGSYSVEVPYKWTGTVVPTKDGYVFDPGQRDYPQTLMAIDSQDYYGSRIKYILTGNLGVDGATLEGFKDSDVVYGADGYFEAHVNWGSNVVLTPKLDGYTFKPANRRLAQVKENMKDLNFNANAIIITIHGTTGGLPDVELQGLYTADGQPVKSDQLGRYSVTVPYGWSGQVTPVKEGYSFTPPARSYNNLKRDVISDLYRPARVKIAISGTIPDMDGVILRGFPVLVKTVRGGYSTQVEYGWSGTVTPEKQGYEFDPPSIQYTNLKTAQTNQDFKASVKHYTISGSVRDQHGPIAGAAVITLLGSPIHAVTDTNGHYELRVEHDWSGPVSVLKKGYTFIPPKRQIAAAMHDEVIDFTGKLRTFKITGAVIINGTPIQDVTITATNGGSTMKTDTLGRYTVEVPYNWSGDIVPTKEGWNFDPPSKSYSNVLKDIDETKPKSPEKPVATESQPPATTPQTPSNPTPSVSKQGFEQNKAGANMNKTASTPSDVNAPKNPEIQKLKDQIEELQKTVGKSGKAKSAKTKPYVSDRGPIVNNEYDQAPLRQILSDLSSDTGIPITADQQVAATVSCTFPSVPLEDALDIALAGTGYVWKKTDYGGYLVMAPSGDVFPTVAQTKRVKLRYITGSTAMGLLSPAIRKYVQAEKDGHIVTVTADGSLLKHILATLKTLDATPRTVLLTTRVVSLLRSNLLNLGINWTWPTVSAGLSTYSTTDSSKSISPWGVQIGYSPDLTFTNALTMTLNLLAKNGQAKLIAEPKIFALDGHEATFKVINEDYFMLTPTQQSGQIYYSQAQLTTIKTGTTLDIVPTIADNNDIYLKVAVELSDTVAKNAETGLPVVTRRNYSSDVVVHNGGTVAVAGLSKKSQNDGFRHVPVLSKLPLVGDLFKSNSTQSEQQDVAVFITAQLVHARDQYRPNPRTAMSGVDMVPGALANTAMPNMMKPSPTNMNPSMGTMSNSGITTPSVANPALGTTGMNSSDNFNQDLYRSLYLNR